MNVELSLDETIAFGLMLLEVTTATKTVLHVAVSVEIELSDGIFTEHIPSAVAFVSFVPAFDVKSLNAGDVAAACDCLVEVIVLDADRSMVPSSACGSVAVVVGL